MNFKQLINHYESLDKKDLIKKLVDKNSLILKQEDEIDRLNKIEPRLGSIHRICKSYG